MSRPNDFWSRRRAGVEAEKATQERQLEEARAAEVEAVQAEKSDEEVLAELGLPDPDVLKPGDDFSGFMAKAVPDRLRRRALRRLWLSNPALANVDGLVEYGEDYTDAATVIENLQTIYQVGKGMVLPAETEAEAEAEAAVAAVDPEIETPDDETPDDVDDPEMEFRADDEVDAYAEADLEQDQLPHPRRMNFRFQQ